MSAETFRHILSFLFVLIISLQLSGCASSGPTKPNLPYASNQYPSVLTELAQKNPLIVQELGKLPELQDGVTEKELTALKRIIELYRNDPANFENVFNEMYNVGLPEHRKYCSPLQALYWLAEDNEIKSSNNLLSDYSLRKLLKDAWNTDPLARRILSDEQIREVIDGIENEDIRKMYLDDIQNGVAYHHTQASLAASYRRSKRMKNLSFSENAGKIIEENLLTPPKSPTRWSSYTEIVERLNAPELLDFYIDHNIKYYHRIPNFHRSGRSIIKEGYGDCDDLANFGRIILSKAGYDVFGRIVGNGRSSVHIGLGLKLDDGSYLLAVNLIDSNNLSGPYSTILELDRALGFGPSYPSREYFYFTW